MRIVIFEYASGGGYSGKPLPIGVLTEGFAMLRTTASDFQEAGHEVTVLLDDRISKLNPPLNVTCTVPIYSSEETQSFLKNIARINDATLIIAPETSWTLPSLVNIIEQSGKTSLNCQSDAIQKVSDKIVLFEILQKAKVATPKTLAFKVTTDLEAVKKTIKTQLGYPVVIKPLDGAGCSGLSLVPYDTQVALALTKVKAESSTGRFIAQEFIRGEAASVSLLIANGKPSPISLNKQNISLGQGEQTSTYIGGEVPFNHPLKQEAFAVAEKVAKLIPGLRGYVGIDLILAKDKLFVVDVNPRLTTSYVGISKTCGFNVSQALLEAVLEGKLPSIDQSSRFAYFSKIESSKPTFSSFHRAKKMSAVLSPPFPLVDNETSCSLLAGFGDSPELAKLEFEEAKRHLLPIVSRGK